MSAHPETGRNRLECRTCPYEYAIATPLFSRREFARKEKEDVFGGPGAWDNAQKTKVQCPTEGCDGGEAAFFQVQIRSADEPMTSFFKVGPPLPPLCPLPRGISSNQTVHDVWKPVAGELESGCALEGAVYKAIRWIDGSVEGVVGGRRSEAGRWRVV